MDTRVFGPLRERSFDLAAPVVLVCGPNESGKSSFRSALDTVLFGFEPARREIHPLFVWDEEGGDLRIEAEVELDDGARLAVERVLLSTGKSRFAEPGDAFEGAREGNGPVPGIESTPRELFRSIYSLEVDSLAALDTGVQAQVDHLLLPAGIGAGLRPTHKVLSELRREHKALWRPDLRGKTRAQKIGKDLADAKRDARRVAQEEEELRAAVDEREDLAERVKALRERRTRLEQAEREAPFLRRLFELDYRRRAAPPAVDLQPLGSDALEDPQRLGEEIREIEARLEAPRARLDREPLHLGDAERLFAEHAAQIDAALRSRGELEALEGSLLEYRDQLRRFEEARGGELRSLGEPDPDRLARLPLDVLRSRREEWESARERAAVVPPRGTNRVNAGLFVAGLALLALAALSSTSGAILWLLILAGLAVIAAAVVRDRRGATPAPAATPSLDESVRNELVACRIDEALLASPSSLQRVIDAVERVQRTEAEVVAMDAKVDVAEKRRGEIEARWIELGRTLGVMELWGVEVLAEIERRRAAAHARTDLVRDDGAERRAAEQSIATLAPSLSTLQRRRERLERTLRLNQPKTTELHTAYEEVVRRLQEETWLRQQAEELERDPRWSALRDDPRASADADPELAPWHPERARARTEELARLEEERSAVDRRLGEITQLLAGDPGARQARALEVVRSLERELAEAHRERDRLALLERILEHADRRFRTTHQPDVLRRAGEYLRLVSDGRYTRLDAETDTRASLRVYSEELGVSIPVGPPLSRGTRDQIHLCLRLGLLDHLDDEREKLPLVLDEVLVHWDTGRRQAMYPLLSQVATRRQVFLLTCHEWLAEETEQALGVQRHALQSGAPVPGEAASS